MRGRSNINIPPSGARCKSIWQLTIIYLSWDLSTFISFSKQFEFLNFHNDQTIVGIKTKKEGVLEGYRFFLASFFVGFLMVVCIGWWFWSKFGRVFLYFEDLSGFEFLKFWIILLFGHCEEFEFVVIRVQVQVWIVLTWRSNFNNCSYFVYYWSDINSNSVLKKNTLFISMLGSKLFDNKKRW